MKPLLILAISSLLVGCSTTATLIPIRGPLATAGAPEIKATVAGIMGHDGTLTFTMPDGEKVSGRWQSVDTGHGYSTKGAGTARGERGTVFDFEFEADGFARGVGTASDNRGNSYRLMVRGV